MNQMMGSSATSMSTIFNRFVNISPPGIDILDVARGEGVDNLPPDDRVRQNFVPLDDRRFDRFDHHAAAAGSVRERNGGFADGRHRTPQPAPSVAIRTASACGGDCADPVAAARKPASACAAYTRCRPPVRASRCQTQPAHAGNTLPLPSRRTANLRRDARTAT